jgi:hypothetical protein
MNNIKNIPFEQFTKLKQFDVMNFKTELVIIINSNIIKKDSIEPELRL